MSTNKKRLQLRCETLRMLNADELDHIHGGTGGPEPITPKCQTWIPEINTDEIVTPADGIPGVVLPKPDRPQKPENNARPYQPTITAFIPKPQSRPGRSANGYCTGI
jgi:hypothetical protein